MYWEKNNPLLVKMHALLCVHPLVVTHCEEKRMDLNCTGSENIQPVCPLAHHYLPPLKMHIGLWVKFSLQVSMKTKQRTFTYCYINRFSKIYLYVINSMNSRLILSIFLHYKGNLKTILEKPSGTQVLSKSAALTPEAVQVWHSDPGSQRQLPDFSQQVCL